MYLSRNVLKASGIEFSKPWLSWRTSEILETYS